RPALEKLGDVHMVVVGRVKLASSLLQRNMAGDRERAAELFCQALATAQRMRIPEAEQIRGILKAHDLTLRRIGVTELHVE
ncbi:MAG: hypothetical protein V3T72_11920, partial [Thermoanaerobaculia bacterium]